MDKVKELQKFLTAKGPPRPGLVPQSGNPEHPGRWVRPSEGGSSKPVSSSTQQASVNDSLDTAVHRRPDIDEWSAEELAEDLVDYFDKFEDADPKALIPLVEQWQAKRPKVSESEKTPVARALKEVARQFGKPTDLTVRMRGKKLDIVNRAHQDRGVILDGESYLHGMSAKEMHDALLEAGASPGKKSTARRSPPPMYD